MRVVLLCALVIGCASAQYAKSGVKGGHGGQGYGHHAGENMVSLFGNRTQQGSTEQHGTSGHTEVGVCYIEVPTATLAKDPRHVPAGNGSRPDLSVIRSCCSGYERNPYNYRLCDPVCTKQCVNAICTAPETCSCFPDHVRDYTGACVATCPIGCLHGRCAGGECMCNEGYVLDFDSKYCIPTCKENCGGVGNCTALNVCTCRPGYKSTREGNCKPDCGHCINGDCVGPNECRCQLGYTKNTQGECVSQCTRGCAPNEKCVGPNRCEPVTVLVPGQGPHQPFQPSPYPDHRNQTTYPYYPNQIPGPIPNTTSSLPFYPNPRPGYPYPSQYPSNPDQNRYPGQPNYFVQPGSGPTHYPPTSENQVRNYSTPNATQIPQQPGSQPGSQPGYQPGYQPGNQPGYLPGNQPGYQPGHQPGNQPGYQPGNQPGYQPGQQPGNQHGYQPGHQPGYQPGHQPAGNPPQLTPTPGNPATNGSQVPYQPGSQTGYQPGHQPPYQPGSQPIYGPGFQPVPQPGYQPGQQPGYQPGYQPNYPPGYPSFGVPPNQTYPGYVPNYYFQPGYYQPNFTAPGQPGQQPPFRPDFVFYQPMYPNPYAPQNNTLPDQSSYPYPGNLPTYPYLRNPNGTTPNEIYSPGYQPVTPNGYPTQNGGNPNAPNSTYPGQGPYPTQEHAVNHSPNFFNPYGSDYNQQYSQNSLCSSPCVNGQCVGIDRCSCNRGYVIDHSDPSGFSCKPVCIGGCMNGVCTAPNVCVCNEGYSMNTGVKGRMMCVKRIRRAVPVVKKP